MIDPYRMIIVNLIASTLLITGIIVYKFIYPKRNIDILTLLILLSLLPLISILRKGIYESGALSSHVKIAMPFYQTLIEGNFIPAWSNMLCAGWGCPNYIFMYPLPYYAISFFHLLNFSFVNSIKLLLAISFVSSGIAMYFFVKENLGKIPALLSSIFYLYAPYHLVDLHFRVAIGEIMAFIFLPLNFLFVKKITKERKVKWMVLEAFSLVFLILSHQVISLASFPFIVLYGFLNLKINKKLKHLSPFIFSIILGLLISSFYWVPIIFEAKFIHWGLKPKISFPEFWEFVYSPWRYGLLFQGPKGELSFIIGYIQFIVIIASVFLLLKKKIKISEKFLLLFSLFSFFILFLLMQSFSKPIWNFFPVLKNFQFSYRLLLLTSFFTSIIAGIFIKTIKNRLILVLILFLVIFSTILNWGNRRTIPEINDEYLKKELISANPCECPDLNTPKWVDLKKDWIIIPPKTPIEIIEGKANIIQVKRNTIKHEYIINAKTNIVVKENTFYFPGWIVKANNKEYPIFYENPQYPGVITFKLNKGDYKVETIFTDTPIRRISKWISIGTFLALIFYLIFKSPKPKINF